MSNSQWHDDQVRGEAALRRMQDEERQLLRDAKGLAQERDDARAEVERLRNAIASFVYTIDSAEQHFETRDKGGQQVPFHGDFVGAWQLPSTWSRLMWWRNFLRAALDGR